MPKPSAPNKPEEIASNYEDLKRQIRAEYKLAEEALKPKISKWKARLKLYNNQMREDDRVGATTLFAVFQTLLANLYNDRLTSEWVGRDEGDNEVADNLIALSKYDYDEMDKDMVDYDWDWDTLFFGRGILGMVRYVRDPEDNIFVPIPEVWDPLTFLRDPFCSSINGWKYSDNNAARFFGRMVMMTESEMEDHPDIEMGDFDTYHGGGDLHSMVSQASRARAKAQGRQTKSMKRSSKVFGANRESEVLEWFTHYDDGSGIKKVRVWLVNDATKVIGMQELPFDYWPVMDRSIYRTSHDFDGVSVPDLIEDKQRLRAITINLGMDAMKTDLQPHYLYDTNKIQNKKDLQPGFNKFTPVNVDQGESVQDAVIPMRKSAPNLGLADYILQTIKEDAERATATSQIQQGMLSDQDKTLGEINLATARGGRRYSLAAKIFGWSEKRFWQHWYQMYKEYFADDIDEKVIRIEGAFGAKWRPLNRKDIVGQLDPDVRITSKSANRAEEMEERQAMTAYFNMALNEPTVNQRYGLKRLGRLYGLQKDEIDRLLPKTIDERIAEQQNERLNENKTVDVLREDNHNVHLEIHAKAKQTPATMVHITAHEQALTLRKKKPELFPEEERAAAFTQPGMEMEQPQGAGGAELLRGVTPSETSGGQANV